MRVIDFMEKHVTLPLLFYAAEGASLQDVAYEKTKKCFLQHARRKSPQND